MALIIADRVQELSTSFGTGDFVTTGAVLGYSRFSSRMAVGDTCTYVIVAVDAQGIPTGEWESGTGTYSAANTITRTTVRSSSANDLRVNFGIGSKRVFIDLSAADIASFLKTAQDSATYAAERSSSANLSANAASNSAATANNHKEAAAASATAAADAATRAEAAAAIKEGNVSYVAYNQQTSTSTKPAVPTAHSRRTARPLSLRDQMLSFQVNFLDFWDATEWHTDCSAKLQEVMNWVSKFAKLMKVTTQDSNHKRMRVRVFLPRGIYPLYDQIYVPPFVDLVCVGIFIRVPSRNFTNPGLINPRIPAIVVVPWGHMTECSINGRGADSYTNSSGVSVSHPGGSCVAFGQSWGVKRCTVVNAGSGYTDGQEVWLQNDGPSSEFARARLVLEVNSSGVVTGAVASTVASRAKNPDGSYGYYAYPAKYSPTLTTEKVVSTQGGSGLTLKISENGPLFHGGNYNTGTDAITACITFGTLQCSDYGYSGVVSGEGGACGVIVAAKNIEGDRIEVEKGTWGMLVRNGSDFRMNLLNVVHSDLALKVNGYSAFTIGHLVFDSCLEGYGDFDSASGVYLAGRCFVEQSNVTRATTEGRAGGTTGRPGKNGYAIRIGQSANKTNTNLDFHLAFSNTGKPRADGGCPVMYLANAEANRFNLMVGDVAYDSATADYTEVFNPHTSIVEFGPNAKATNVINGQGCSTHALMASATAGNSIPNCGMRIWDPIAGGYCGPGGLYECYGTTDPTVNTGAGSGATATAVRNSSTNTITSITVNNGGEFYGSPPRVIITGGGGSNAAATANLTHGVVTSITMTNNGSGYTSVPTVTFSGGTKIPAGSTYQRTSSPGGMWRLSGTGTNPVWTAVEGGGSGSTGTTGTDLALSGRLSVGGASSTDGTTTTPLTVTRNSAAAPDATAGTIAHFVGQDATAARIIVDGFGAGQFASVIMRTAGGTNASPSIITGSGSYIGSFSFQGHNGTAYTPTRAAIIATTAETWTSTAQGTHFEIFSTGSGTTTQRSAFRIHANGHAILRVAGAGIQVTEGTNCKQGIATLVGGTVVVGNTSVTANSRIFLTSQADGGTPGFLRVSARTAGVSFTITSSSASDTSIVAYEIFEPSPAS